MTRSIFKLLALAALVCGGLLFARRYSGDAAKDAQIEKLQSDNQQLQLIAQRLTQENRVAELLVTDQKTVNGVPQTTLLFEEYARDGSALPPKSFTISGDEVHLDAMVIKFDHDFVEKDDPLRGHSIALFTRIYGNHQSPDNGSVVDLPGQVPDYYRGADPQISAYEIDLWKNFWRLATDKPYRQSKGVRVPNGEGPWWPCVPERLYTVTLEADGGLNVSSEPVKGIYLEALRKKAI